MSKTSCELAPGNTGFDYCSLFLSKFYFTAGTPGNTMYNLILATDALQEHNRTIAQNDDECQNATSFNKEMVRGKVLICSYGLNFIFGISTLNNVVDTIKTLSAVGVVMITTVDLNGISISNAPFSVPAIMVLSSNGSKVRLLRNTCIIYGYAPPNPFFRYILAS